MRRIILHAGTEKTGTTFLQDVFALNARNLKSAGILYPESGRVFGHHYWLAKALGFKYKPGPVDEALEEKALSKLKDEISGWQGDVLISSEHFDFHVTAETAGRLKEYFGDERIEVVLVIRNQVDYSQSLYVEGLKWAVIRPYDKFLAATEKQGRYSYLRRYQVWKEVASQVTFIDYERNKKDLLEAFLMQAKLNIDAKELQLPHDEQNVTPSIDFLEMIRVCNVNRDPDVRRELYEKSLSQVARHCPELLIKRSFCIPDSSTGVFARAEESNYLLADILGIKREDFLGGALSARVEDYQQCPPPDPLVGFKKLMPALILG